MTMLQTVQTMFGAPKPALAPSRSGLSVKTAQWARDGTASIIRYKRSEEIAALGFDLTQLPSAAPYLATQHPYRLKAPIPPVEMPPAAKPAREVLLRFLKDEERHVIPVSFALPVIIGLAFYMPLIMMRASVLAGLMIALAGSAVALVHSLKIMCTRQQCNVQQWLTVRTFQTQCWGQKLTMLVLDDLCHDLVLRVRRRSGIALHAAGHHHLLSRREARLPGLAWKRPIAVSSQQHTHHVRRF